MSVTVGSSGDIIPLGGEGHTVTLSMPAQPELWSLARMTASGIASRLDFNVEEIEDLRLALDELCSTVASGAGGSGRIELSYRWDESSIEIVCELTSAGEIRGEPSLVHAVQPLGEPGSPASELSVDELSARILDALVDEHGVEPSEQSRRCGWLRKRRSRGAEQS